MTFERLRGFRDLYPEDAEPKSWALSVAQEIARSFGFRMIDIPSLESLDLYRLKSGDELVGQTFSFTDKGGREVTMVPEATPSVVRMLTARKDIPRPVRWFSIPKIWRYEEPQSGRLREHMQFNADIFGVDTPEADAEIIGLAATILDGLNLQGDYDIRINDRKLMENLLHKLDINNISETFSIIDRFRKTGHDDFSSMLRQSGIPDRTVSDIVSILEHQISPGDLKYYLSSYIDIDQNLGQTIDRMETTLRIISQYTNSRIYVDFSTVRGLSYYTGIVFEVFDAKGELRSILGGGRYDSLAKLISGQDIPAVGFGMGDVVLELLLKRSGLWKSSGGKLRYYVCTASDDLKKEALEIVIELRKNGFIATMDIAQRNLSAQLKNATINSSDYSIIVGKKELETDKVTIRNMSDGTQQQIDRMKIADEMKKIKPQRD